jgi:hypothetical protein
MSLSTIDKRVALKYNLSGVSGSEGTWNHITGTKHLTLLIQTEVQTNG